MYKLINNKEREVLMKKTLLISIMGYLSTGCTPLSFNSETSSISKEQFSCDKEAEPKSLDFLEQQYRCTRDE